MANNQITRRALLRSRSRRFKAWWNKLITGMAAVVVFCTTYALILPAITEEQVPTCDVEAHVHDDTCMELPKELTCAFQLIADEKTHVIHTHNECCYDLMGELICSLPELKEHTHTDACYTLVTPEAPHVHTDACWKETQEQICGLEESQGHTHDENCTTQETRQICELEETPGHAHIPECQDAEGNLICGQEESAGHTHGPECSETQTVYTCGLEASEPHTHTETCIETKKELICGKTEATEEELANPPQPYKVLSCDKPELALHGHDENCFDEAGNLTCNKSEVFEHIHTASCLTTTTDPNAKEIVACGLEEHTHDPILCYIDNEADLETQELWESTLPELTGEDWAENLLAVAASQLDYEESTVNVTVTPDGEILGYTRYGQWAGELYGPWSELFAKFCRHYAGIPQDAFPRHEGKLLWCEELQEENWGIYLTPDLYTPVPGDLVCLDTSLDGIYDSVAIVEQLLPATEEEEAKLLTIQGDVENAVRRVTYKPDAPEILGYASTAAARTRWDILNPQPLPEPEEPTRYCGLEEHAHGETCEPDCPLEEHTHDDACLVPPPVYICGQEQHRHEDACYDNEGTLTCQLPEHDHVEACIQPTYYCGLEEHTHAPQCEDDQGNLICEATAHTHTELCEQPPKTYYCGLEEHTHAPECMDPQGVLICEKPVHTHDASCEEAPKTYYCGKTQHAHVPECQDETGAYICGLDEHTHSEACEKQIVYYCFKTQHAHGSECYNEAQELTCSQEEHTHTEDCQKQPVYYCGLEPHAHAETCYDEAGELTCILDEHTHSESCVLLQQSLEAVIMDNIVPLASPEKVTVQGLLPMNARAEAVKVDIEGMLFAYNITIYDSLGREFEPVDPVNVTFAVPGITDNPNLDLQAYQIPELEAPQQLHEVPSTPSAPIAPVAFAAPAVFSAPSAGVSEEADPTEEVTTEEATTEEVTTPVKTVTYGEPQLLTDAVTENGQMTLKAPNFQTFGAAAEWSCCALDDYLDSWIPTGPDNPFGSAQLFNVFLLGDLNGWNAIHGNAAVGGNILGNKAMTIGYSENSNFDWEANLTPAQDITLLLKGDIKAPGYETNVSYGDPLPKALVVLNGNAVIKDRIVTQANDDADDAISQHQIQLNNSIRPETHFHEFPSDYDDDFEMFFAKAGMEEAEETYTLTEEEAAETLIAHNQRIYDYSLGLEKGKDDGHLGTKFFPSADPKSPYYMTGDQLDALLGEGSNHSLTPDRDLVLHGENMFYNVFNLKPERIAPKGTEEPTRIYLDIPYGSYVMINLVGVSGENNEQITSVEDFGIQLWYKDSNGQWSDQPAKIKGTMGEDYNQSQMVLLNVDPAIQELHWTAGNYLYTSVLAPKTDFYSDTHETNLHGTIVFDSMTGGTLNNNAVYSPFYTGASFDLTKETYCDTPNADHKSLSDPDGLSCQIDGHGINGNGEKNSEGIIDKGWQQYYADILFNVSTSPGEPGYFALKRDLPLNGKNLHVSGASPGYYTVAEELIWVEAHNDGFEKNEDGSFKVDGDGNRIPSADYKTRRLTVDKDGYYMVALYLGEDYMQSGNVEEDLNANYWTLVYCNSVKVTMNEDGTKDYECSIPANKGEWLTPKGLSQMVPQELEAARAQMVQSKSNDFHPYGHKFKHAVFRQGGVTSPIITVQSGTPAGAFVLENHYTLDPEKTVTVYKSWGEWKEVAAPTTGGDTTTQTDLSAAERSLIKEENGKTYRWFAVPDPVGARIGATLKWSTDENNDDSYTVVDIEGIPNPITLTAGTKWSGLWTGLPETDASGNPYYYKVEESAEWPGYKFEGAEETDTDVWVLKNSPKDVPIGSLSVTKKWANENGSPMTDEEVEKQAPVTVNLYRREGTVPKPYNPNRPESAGNDKANASVTKSITVTIDNPRHCGMVTHTHTDICYAVDQYQNKNLACGYEAHTHSEDCRGTAALDPVYFVTAGNGSDLTVTLQVWLDGAISSSYWYGADQLKLTGTGAEVETISVAAGTTIPTTYQKTIDVHPGVATVDATESKAATPVTITATLKNASSHVSLHLTGPALESPEIGVTAPLITAELTAFPQIQCSLAEPQVDRYDPAIVEWEPTITFAGSITGSTQQLSGGNTDPWSYTWENLPLFEGDGDGSTTNDNPWRRYGYYVIEEVPKGFEPSYLYSATGIEHDGSFKDTWGTSPEKNPPKDADGNDVPAVSNGFITIRNAPEAPKGGPELPMTGGVGTIPYTLGGLLTSGAAIFLARYKVRKRRREDQGE